MILFDMQKALGAKEAFSFQKFSIYFPNKDRNNNPVRDVEDWIRQGMRLLTEINTGVTRLPAAQGNWKNVETGEVISEDTVVIYSFLREPEKFHSRSKEVQAFLKEFGLSTNQGEVMVEFFGEEESGGLYSRAYIIDDFATL